MSKIIITDSSLRDGNHAVKHKINLDSIKRYCQFADAANIPIIEVGHGNGLGASSLLIGQSPFTDEEMLTTAKENLKTSKLGIHIIPGITTINKDIKKAIDIGVDVYRVATHCTEATLSKSHIEYLKNQNKEVFGVLMMSALADSKTLCKNALIMEEYGADAIIIMDSTGTYLPKDVHERLNDLKDCLNIPYGFHAHDNLGLATSNSLVAAQCGATYIDGCIRGFGAGAGNAHLEMLIPVLEKSGFITDIDFQKVIIEADKVMDYLIPSAPISTPVNVLTGLNRLFSGFENPIIKASKLYGIEYSSLIFELGNRKLVAGQEDLILEIAQKIKNESINYR
jgi:4-hydroxy 2-oxovalerate aldolase